MGRYKRSRQPQFYATGVHLGQIFLTVAYIPEPNPSYDVKSESTTRNAFSCTYILLGIMVLHVLHIQIEMTMRRTLKQITITK